MRKGCGGKRGHRENPTRFQVMPYSDSCRKKHTTHVGHNNAKE